MKRKMPVSSPN